MPIKPGKDETQSEWMSRCVPEMLDADSSRTQEQAVAICIDIWRNRNKQDVAPDPGERHSDFMDRCIAELTDDGMSQDDAEDFCRIAWEERMSRKIPEVMHKTHAGQHDGLEFILSDESPDRMGDIIMAEGWKLANF